MRAANEREGVLHIPTQRLRACVRRCETLQIRNVAALCGAVPTV